MKTLALPQQEVVSYLVNLQQSLSRGLYPQILLGQLRVYSLVIGPSCEAVFPSWMTYSTILAFNI
jgi:hypothetical protein